MIRCSSCRDVADWFTPGRDSPYMLEAVQVRGDVRDQVPDPSFTRMAENFRRTHGPGAPFTDPSILTGAFGVVNPLRRS